MPGKPRFVERCGKAEQGVCHVDQLVVSLRALAGDQQPSGQTALLELHHAVVQGHAVQCLHKLSIQLHELLFQKPGAQQQLLALCEIAQGLNRLKYKVGRAREQYAAILSAKPDAVTFNRGLHGLIAEQRAGERIEHLSGGDADGAQMQLLRWKDLFCNGKAAGLQQGNGVVDILIFEQAARAHRLLRDRKQKHVDQKQHHDEHCLGFVPLHTNTSHVLSFYKTAYFAGASSCFAIPKR